MIMISTMIFFSFHKQAQTCSGLKRKTKASKSTWYCLVFMLRQFQALYFLYFVFCISFHRFPQICCATPPTTALSRSKSKVLLMMMNSLLGKPYHGRGVLVILSPTWDLSINTTPIFQTQYLRRKRVICALLHLKYATSTFTNALRCYQIKCKSLVFTRIVL